MTVVWFLSNNSVTSEANHLKCETLMQGSWAYKTPNNCRNRSKGSPLQGDSLPKSGNFCHFGGCIPTQFTDWQEILLGQADPRAPQQCQISHELVQ